MLKGITNLMPLSKEPSPYSVAETSVLEKKAPNLTPFSNLLETSNVYPLSPARYSPAESLKLMSVLGSLNSILALVM